MIDAESLKQLFPRREEDIPPDYRLIAPIHQSSTLLNGEIKPWRGEMRPVSSPICIRTDGDLRQMEIGSAPQGSLEEAEEALDAAAAAYDNGRRRVADHDRRRAHRLHAEFHQADGRTAASRS